MGMFSGYNDDVEGTQPVNTENETSLLLQNIGRGIPNNEEQLKSCPSNHRISSPLAVTSCHFRRAAVTSGEQRSKDGNAIER